MAYTKKFICIQCGKEFEKKLYGKGREYRFCGYDCYWQHKQGKQPEHLKEYGFQQGSKVNVGRKRPDVTLRNLTNNPMKNIETQEKSSKTHTIHGRWSGRTKALRYKEYKCEMFSKECEGKLEAHHKNKDRSDNRISNMMFLCKKHHVMIHKRLNELTKKDGSSTTNIYEESFQRSSKKS